MPEICACNNRTSVARGVFYVVCIYPLLGNRPINTHILDNRIKCFLWGPSRGVILRTVDTTTSQSVSWGVQFSQALQGGLRRDGAIVVEFSCSVEGSAVEC
jgi:hypothetical protein